MDSKLVSVLTPVYRPVIDELRQCLKSVVHQSVEHILVLDGAKDALELAAVSKLAQEFGARLIVRERNGGISRATNDAADIAVGEFLLFLDQDDFLEPRWFAQFNVVAEDADFIYSDAYVVSARGKVLARLDKPEWSPVRLVTSMYACHFFAIRKLIFHEIGGMRPEFDGAQDHDIALRVSRQDLRVEHIRYPLYNWRQSANSTAANPENKPWAFDAGVAASRDHLRALEIDAEVSTVEGAPGCYHVQHAERSEPVSVVVPSAFASNSDGKPFLRTLMESLGLFLGNVAGDEIIVVSGDEDDRGLLKGLELQVQYSLIRIIDSEKFNFSRRCNIGIDRAANDLVLLVNDDIEFVDSRTCDQLVGALAYPNVGLVGMMLKYRSSAIQHAGHKYQKTPMHAYYRATTLAAPLGELVVDREVAGVTGAVMMQRKSMWAAVGGFATLFPLNYNDVDYCLKVRALGMTIIQMNSTWAYHDESQTRDNSVEQSELDNLMARWPVGFAYDGYTRN